MCKLFLAAYIAAYATAKILHQADFSHGNSSQYSSRQSFSLSSELLCKIVNSFNLSFWKEDEDNPETGHAHTGVEPTKQSRAEDNKLMIRTKLRALPQFGITHPAKCK